MVKMTQVSAFFDKQPYGRVDNRVRKTLSIKARNGFRPKYISDLLPRYEPSRPPRSSGSGLLSVPRVRTKPGAAALSYYEPHIWNKLPENCRSARLSPPLYQDWKCFCLPLKQFQVFELHKDFDSTVLSLLKLFYFSQLVLMCFFMSSYSFLNAIFFIF